MTNMYFRWILLTSDTKKSASNERNKIRVEQRAKVHDKREVYVYYQGGNNPITHVAKRLENEFLFVQKSYRRPLSKETKRTIVQLLNRQGIQTIQGIYHLFSLI